jgi:hypothetical protein
VREPNGLRRESSWNCAVEGEIHYFDTGTEGCAEAGSPAAFIVDGGVANQDDFEGVILGRGGGGQEESKEDWLTAGHWFQ